MYWIQTFIWWGTMEWLALWIWKPIDLWKVGNIDNRLWIKKKLSSSTYHVSWIIKKIEYQSLSTMLKVRKTQTSLLNMFICVPELVDLKVRMKIWSRPIAQNKNEKVWRILPWMLRAGFFKLFWKILGIETTSYFHSEISWPLA